MLKRLNSSAFGKYPYRSNAKGIPLGKGSLAWGGVIRDNLNEAAKPALCVFNRLSLLLIFSPGIKMLPRRDPSPKGCPWHWEMLNHALPPTASRGTGWWHTACCGMPQASLWGRQVSVTVLRINYFLISCFPDSLIPNTFAALKTPDSPL